MTELPMWNVHTLDGKKEVIVVHGISAYVSSWLEIDEVGYYLDNFTITKNENEYTLKGTAHELGGDLINIFINYNKRYIILGK
ncbi:hypothetical protein OLACOIGA_00051 [Enterococcus phage vB_Efa29212_2e]|nr:hypothetical protein OLACOIGA_00051 [Enterococcus phage vB_Efa29212_2e]